MKINVFVSGSPTTQMLIMYVCRHLHYLISFRKEKEVSGTQDVACFSMYLLPAHDSFKQALFASWSRKIMNFFRQPTLLALFLFVYRDLSVQMDNNQYYLYPV